MESIEKCIVKRAHHEQEIQNRLKRLNERKLHIQECMVQKVKASDASLGEKYYSRIVSDKGNDQGLENQSNTSRDKSSRSRNECYDKSTSGDDTDIRLSYDTKRIVEVPYTAEYNVFAVDTQHSEQPECIINTCIVEKVNSNVIPDSPNMCDNEIRTDQNVVECDDERVVLANLIANLKLDVDENKKIQKQFKNANTSLDHELKECKSILAETSRTLGESNSIRDSYLIALQNKQTELETYKTLNDRTVDYDKLEHKLNETLGLLAQKEIDIKEGLKLKAYEILVVKEKHDELVKQRLLTKSHYEGLVKEKTKVITDLKLKEEKDIDTMISMENQLKFLNEIVYKRNQSIQTIHMKSSFAKTYDVNAPDPSRNSPKHVSFQSPRESVGSNDMVHNHYLKEAKKKAQLQKDKALNTKSSVQQSVRLPNTANEKKCDSKNHGRKIPIGKRFSPNKSSNVYLKTTPPRSGLTWKPTDRICTQVGLKWIPIIKSVETRYNTNDSASPLGMKTHNPKTVICANSSSLSAVKMDILLEPTSNKLLTYCKHQDSRIKKAQDSKIKTSANSDIQDLPSRYQVYQGRLLASFQDDPKYENVGQDTRSQGGKDDQDKQGKDLEISEQKTKSKDNDKG
ncbi:hypothetical protein Tco_0468196 [Tanacetum coccineum]